MTSFSIRVLAFGVVASLVGVTGWAGTAVSAPAGSAVAGPTGGWRAAWTAAQHHPVPGYDEAPNWSTTGFDGQTLRQVVRVSSGGATVRIRLSNRFGTTPLRVTGATIGRSASGADVRPGSLRRLTFARSQAAVVPAGGELVSDAALLATRPLDSLTVSLYFAGPTGPTTFHEGALATSYLAAGDHRLDRRGGAFDETSGSWYLLAGVDTAVGRRTGVVVAFGDSLTDGYGTTPNADNRYPDQLAERLTDGSLGGLGVVNAGINGNKLLADSPCYGAAGIRRFDRDALGLPGVRVVVVLAGINDIGGGGFPDFGCGASPVVSADQVIDAHRALVRAAHAGGVRIVGVTMPPIKGAYGFDTPRNEAVRDAVNEWIRTDGGFDAVADVDAALSDPADRDALQAVYDSGDHLHPNDAGADVLARTVAPAVRAVVHASAG